MAKIVLKGSFTSDSSYMKTYLDYIAKRDGVDIKFTNKDASATQKQDELVRRMVNDYPFLRNDKMVKDYFDQPTKYLANEIIHKGLDEAFQDNSAYYIKYIAERPGVVREEEHSHGLFTTNGDADLEAMRNELDHHQGNAWKLIISLPEGSSFTSREDWERVCRENYWKIANAFNVDIKNFRWAAAVHQAHNPHVHIQFWSKNPSDLSFRKEDSLERLNRVKSLFANSIYRNEIDQLNSEKELIRNSLKEEFVNQAHQLFKQSDNIVKMPEHMKQEYQLLKQLNNVMVHEQKGSYEYQTKECKQLINESVKAILELPGIKEQFEYLLENQEQYYSIYNDDEKIQERMKEFKLHFVDPGKYDKKEIHNLVLNLARELSTFKEFEYYRIDIPEADSQVTDFSNATRRQLERMYQLLMLERQVDLKSVVNQDQMLSKIALTKAVDVELSKYAKFYYGVHQALGVKCDIEKLRDMMLKRFSEVDLKQVDSVLNQVDQQETYKATNKQARKLASQTDDEYQVGISPMDKTFRKGLNSISSNLFNSTLQNAYENERAMKLAHLYRRKKLRPKLNQMIKRKIR